MGHQPESTHFGASHSSSPNAFDFFVWGFFEDKVFSGKPTIDKLKFSKAQEVAGVSADQIGRFVIHLKDCRWQNLAVPIWSTVTLVGTGGGDANSS